MVEQLVPIRLNIPTRVAPFKKAVNPFQNKSPRNCINPSATGLFVVSTEPRYDSNKTSGIYKTAAVIENCLSCATLANGVLKAFDYELPI